MKTRLSALAALCLTLGITSCSYRVFPVEALDRGYKDSMITESEIETMSDVTIYLSEAEVPAGYKLLSFAEFKPLVKSYSSSVKRFYKKAVLKAEEFGGNAIIITGPNQFKIIEVPARHKMVKLNEPVKTLQQVKEPEVRTRAADENSATEQEVRIEKTEKPLLEKLKAGKQKIEEKKAGMAEARKQKAETAKAEAEAARAEAKAAKAAKAAEEEARREEIRKAEEQKAEAREEVVTKTAAKKSVSGNDNPIFNDDNLQWFTSKYIYAATEQEQIQIVQALKDEIRSNINACKTAEEAEFISKKIDVLEAYNKALPTPSGTQAAEINGFRNALKASIQDGKTESSSSRILDGNKLKDSVKGLLGKIKR